MIAVTAASIFWTRRAVSRGGVFTIFFIKYPARATESPADLTRRGPDTPTL